MAEETGLGNGERDRQERQQAVTDAQGPYHLWITPQVHTRTHEYLHVEYRTYMHIAQAIQHPSSIHTRAKLPEPNRSARAEMTCQSKPRWSSDLEKHCPAQK